MKKTKQKLAQLLHRTFWRFKTLCPLGHVNISLGDRQNDGSTRLVLLGTHRYARCMHFEVLTPTSTYRQFIICIFYLSKFHTNELKILPSDIISFNFIYSANGIFKWWEFYLSCPSAGNKQTVHVVSFACRAHTLTSFCRAHNNIYREDGGVSWHVFHKNAHKTQESLISAMSDVLVKR